MINWYKKAQTDIQYLGAVKLGGQNCVWFRISDDFWAYTLSFPKFITIVKKMAAYSPGKALAWAKKNKSDAFKVTKDFPMPGSIIREEGEEEEDPIERAEMLGEIAFRNGKQATPALDQNLMKMLKGNKVGEGTSLLDAWIKGWHKANLA